MSKNTGSSSTQSWKEFHPWDTRMKWLFAVAPEDMVAWLLGDAIEFAGLANPQLESDYVVSDMLCYVARDGEKGLFHIEFQKRRDTNMAQRLWEYNTRATIKYKLPVWSCVVYLTKDGTTPEGSYKRIFPLTGRLVQEFHFDVLKMWEIPTEKLLSVGRQGLLPLLPLTREGQQREVIDTAIDLLMPRGEESQHTLLSLVYGFASLVFEQKDQEWLQRRFSMLYDILRESPAFQDMAREGKREGLEQGRAEGEKIGALKMGRQLATGLAARFSNAEFTAYALQIIEGIDDEQILQRMTISLANAPTLEATRQVLTDLP